MTTQDNLQVDEAIELLESRMDQYQVVYFLFEEPKDGDIFIQLQESGTGYVWEAVLPDAGPIAQFIEEYDEEKGKELLDEYRRLFVGPGQIVAPLWESVYTDKDGLLFGQSTLDMRNLLQEQGLVYTEKNKYPEDHLLLQLEFMMYLLQKGIQELEQDQQISEKTWSGQAQLIQHWERWIPQLNKRIQEGTTHPFYQAAGKILEMVMQWEKELVEEQN